jgi:glycosyltransferase involved in cell wall biosynthesis
MQPEAPPFLSLVIPCYNEQESVPTLLLRTQQALSKLGRPYEVLIVDDGSSDKTPQLLAEAMARLPWLRVLRMARNAGQSAAFEAGFAAARGQLLATIDADLQNDPEEIPRLVGLLDGSDGQPSVDMVTGWRRDRQDTPFRRWQSRQANRIRNWVTGETVQDSASSLKVYRAHCVKNLRLFRGAHRYMPTLVKMRGYTVREEPVRHSHRFAGTAKYGFRNRAFVGIMDLVGVRWLKSRYLRYQCSELGPPGPGPERSGGANGPSA